MNRLYILVNTRTQTRTNNSKQQTAVNKHNILMNTRTQTATIDSKQKTAINKHSAGLLANTLILVIDSKEQGQQLTPCARSYLPLSMSALRWNNQYAFRQHEMHFPWTKDIWVAGEGGGEQKGGGTEWKTHMSTWETYSTNRIIFSLFFSIPLGWGKWKTREGFPR